MKNKHPLRLSWPSSVVGIATGYGLDGPGIESRWRETFSTPVETGPGAHPAPCTMGTGSFPSVKSGRSVTLTPHPLPGPWSWKSRAIPLLPLWAVRPVQSLSACTRVHFTFIYQDHLAVVEVLMMYSYLRLRSSLPSVCYSSLPATKQKVPVSSKRSP